MTTDGEVLETGRTGCCFWYWGSEMSGCQGRHSCQTALTRLTDTWLSAFNKRQISGVVFLDLRNTFDVFDRDILLKKLSAYNLGTETITFLQSCLHGRPQCLLVNDTYSPKNVYHVWSSSRIDLSHPTPPPSVWRI